MRWRRGRRRWWRSRFRAETRRRRGWVGVEDSRKDAKKKGCQSFCLANSVIEKLQFKKVFGNALAEGRFLRKGNSWHKALPEVCHVVNLQKFVGQAVPDALSEMGWFELMFKSNRTFKVWEYRVSFQQLLIRSPQSPDETTNIDLVFWGVETIRLDTLIRSIDVRATDAAAIRSLGLHASLTEGAKAFILSKAEHPSIVISLGMKVLENDLDIFDSSLCSPHDAEDKYRGKVLASS